ncbi:oligoendopeptidase F [Carboxylicivirga sp. M1479]|uniref:oligoendopeptidase F n=1 Tax=Carboxylicivirga sp. M1479 TaxID=2594476 RepID=UPI00117836ED|nr:oligoendopeptidase F [Carboxylicivirga sp. M1479]TRX72510.1 oligoendopeptidase F [Carboxylicivirga sp. M1479]
MKHLVLLCILAVTGLTTVAQVNYKTREEVPEKYKWNFDDIYTNWDAWEADLEAINQDMESIQAYKGKLGESADNLIALSQIQESLMKKAYKAYQFVSLQSTVDNRNMELQAKLQKVQLMFAQFGVETAWMSPEMLQIPEATMKEWIASNDELKVYQFDLMDMYRLQKHVLSEKMEQLMSYYSNVKSTPGKVFTALSTTDIEFPEIELSNGEKVKITPGGYSNVVTNNKNQDDRKAAYEAFYDLYYKNKNTYAAIYNGIVQSDWASARARKYPTCLDAALEGNAIPTDVYLNLINTVKQHTEPLQKYAKLRKKVLGLEKYYAFDGSISLVDFNKKYPYDEALDIVTASVLPLGKDYQAKLKTATSSGWLDVYENPGKRSGAFSSGVYGVHPYMLLNYDETLDYVFTLAHELGHTMHTTLSNETQPFATHNYTIFVAEVASTFNERLLLDYMMEKTNDPLERIALLNQTIRGIIGTFYAQTMFADYEYQVHTLAEQGRPINADILTNVWKELADTYYGDVSEETMYSGYAWTRIPHFYNSPFYVYQYATCFASSAKLYKDVTEGNKKDRRAAIERYITLLQSGGNDHPMEQLKKAGVDLSKPETILAVINQLDTLVDQLEEEINKLED